MKVDSYVLQFKNLFLKKTFFLSLFSEISKKNKTIKKIFPKNRIFVSSVNGMRKIDSKIKEQKKTK